MTTEISLWGNNTAVVVNEEVNFSCPVSDFNRHHEGVWNSRVLAFVPQLTPRQESIFYPDTFSDGTPVASYEQFN